jgi:hypothetical protein
MPAFGWGYIPTPEEAWAQLRHKLTQGFPGQFSFGTPFGGGRRQVSVGMESGTTQTVTLGYDPETGMFESSGRYLYPTEGFKGWGGVGGAMGMLGRMAAGYEPEQYQQELLQYDPYSPFIYQRRQMFGTDWGMRGFTGGQIYAPWTAQQATMRFMGTMGDTPYTDVELALERATPGTHFLPSGIGRRAWAEGFGALGSSMHAMYGTMPGFDVAGDTVRLPYKDVKMRERQDLLAPGRMPWLYGGAQTNPMLLGRYAGVEQRQSLSMFTEFIPGGIFPGGGQSYFSSGAFRGVEMSMGAMHQMEMPYSALNIWAQGGSRPVGSLYAETIGRKQAPGTPLGSLAGIEFGAPPAGPRGLTGFEPMGGRLMLPYGRGFGELMQQYNPSFFQQSGGVMVGGQEYTAEHLMSRPGTVDAITAYRQLSNLALTPDVTRRMGGGMGVYPYMPTSGSAQPYAEWGGQEYFRMQSGMALYTPGLKTVGVGMQSLGGMASDPRTQFVVGGESVKSMQFLAEGLAQTLPQSAWSQFGVGPELFDPQGRLRWGGQPEVAGAIQQMFTGGPGGGVDPRFRELLHQSGGFVQSAWRTFPAGPDVASSLAPGMRYTGGAPQQGQWRPDAGGVSMYLQSIGFPMPITPIDPFPQSTGKTLSFNDLMEVSRWNPAALQHLSGDPGIRGHYGNVVRAAVGSPVGSTRGVPANILEQARSLASTSLGQLNPEWSQMVSSGQIMPSAQFILEAMAQQRPGQFTRVGGALMPPAESILATQTFGELGQPISRLGRLSSAMLATSAQGGDLGELSSQYVSELEKWSSQPGVQREMFGANLPGSMIGRLTFLGGMGLPEGQFGLVVPQGFARGQQISGSDLVQAFRWPADVIPGASTATGGVYGPSEFNAWAREAGAQQIDESFFKGGVVGVVGSMLPFADLTQGDVDRDLLGAMIMFGAAENMSPKDLRGGATRAVSMMGGFSKGADAMAMAGWGLDTFVREKMRMTETSPATIRGQAGRTAIAKSRIGRASNLMDMMKYYTERRRAGLTGRPRELYGRSQQAAWELMGAVKQGFIDQWEGMMGMSPETASDYFMPMTLRGFKGRSNMPDVFTRQVPGRGKFTGEERYYAERKRLDSPYSVFSGFARAAAEIGGGLMEEGDLQSALAGMFGGWVEGEQIQGLPSEIGGYLTSLARGEEPTFDMDISEFDQFMAESPFGRFIKGRTLFQAHMESGMEPRNEREARRSAAIRNKIPRLAGAGGLIAEYAQAVAATSVGRRAGALGTGGKGLQNISDLLTALGGIEAASGVYGDVAALFDVPRPGSSTAPVSSPSAPPEEKSPWASTNIKVARGYRYTRTQHRVSEGTSGEPMIQYADLTPEEQRRFGTERHGGEDHASFIVPQSRYEGRFKPGIPQPPGTLRVYSGGFRRGAPGPVASRLGLAGADMDPIVEQRLRDFGGRGRGEGFGGGGGIPPGGGEQFFTGGGGERDLSGLNWPRLSEIMRVTMGGWADTAAAKDWISAGGMQTGMDPMDLIDLARAQQQNLPLQRSMTKKLINFSRKMAIFGGGIGGPQGETLGMINQLWGQNITREVGMMPSSVDMAWGMGSAGLGQANIAMMGSGLSGSQAMTVDRAVMASEMMGLQEGWVSSTQMGQMKAGLDLARQMGAGDMAAGLQERIAASRMTSSGKLPSLTGGQVSAAVGRVEAAWAGGGAPDFGGSLKDVIEGLQKMSVELDTSEQRLKAKNKVLDENIKLEEMQGPAYKAQFAAKFGVEAGGMTAAQQRLYQMRLGAQAEITGIAEGRLGLMQAAEEVEPPGAIDQARAGLARTLGGGRKFMSFFDLMYMRRLGQVFWGGQMAAGQEVSAQQGMVAQGLYGAGMIDPRQGMMGQVAGLQAQARFGMGQAFNQTWAPVMRGMAGAQGALGPLSSIFGPAAGAGFMANFIGGRFMELQGPALARLSGGAFAATAALGAASYIGYQTTTQGMREIGGAFGSEAAGGPPPSAWMHTRRFLGALGSMIGGELGLGPGFEGYQEQTQRAAAEQFVAQQSGYSRQTMGRLSTAAQLAAVEQRKQNIIWRAGERDIELAPEQASAMATQMTVLAPRGLTSAQEDRVVDAMLMGGDPFGTAAQVSQALTGSPVVAGQTPLGSLAMQYTDPVVAANAQAMTPFASGMQQTLWGMGAEGAITEANLQDMAGMGWGQKEQIRWQGAAGAFGTMARFGQISPAEARRGLLAPSGTDPTTGYGLLGPREFTGEQQRAAEQFQMYAPGMYQQGMDYVVAAMGQQAGVSGTGIATSAEATGMMAQWQQPYGRSILAQQMGLDYLQTLQTAPGFGQGMPVFQAGFQAMGFGAQQWGAVFDRLGVSGGAPAQAFLGETQTSRLTGQAVGGMLGMQYQQQESRYQSSMASLGIQSAMLALRRQYTTGEGMPGGRGFWQVEDDMTRLARQQGTYNWIMAGRRMDLQVAQFNETWNANFDQFQARTEWQREDFATQATKVGMQRAWAREDWAMADNVRSMQWGWQEEDFSENVRFASGRQRRQMVRQRERETQMFNIQGEQIDTQRERQQELWSMEDEQFEKRKARFEETVTWQDERFEREKRYFEEGMSLSREQHEKEMEFMKRRWALEDEMRALQREYQLKQMELQEAALGIQYAALEEQRERQLIQDALNEAIWKAKATQEIAAAAGDDAEAAARRAQYAWRQVLAMLGGQTFHTVSIESAGKQTGFSGLVTKPTLFLAGEGSGGSGGGAEYVTVNRLGAGGIPEAMGTRGGNGGPISVSVYIDGEEVAARVMIDRGNNLRVEALR